MAYYQKKPLLIEAITWSDFIEYGKNNAANIVNGMPWSFLYKGYPIIHEPIDEHYLILTLGETIRFTPKDMLMTDVDGKISTCKISIFKKTYDLVYLKMD